MNEITIRNVTEEDLSDIVEIDKRVYGAISEEVTSSPEILKKRIKISKDWFFVADNGEKVMGFLSLQPTSKPIEKFISWEDSTDGGTLERTYNDAGKYVYGVALTIDPNFRGMGLSERLFKEAAKKMIIKNKKLAYFSGRMPGFYKYKDKMSADKYYNATTERNGRVVALDPQIRMYESYGLKRVRLVKDGFGGDKESADYSVVFTFNNPFYNLPFRKLWASSFSVVVGNDLLTRIFIK